MAQIKQTIGRTFKKKVGPQFHPIDPKDMKTGDMVVMFERTGEMKPAVGHYTISQPSTKAPDGKWIVYANE